MEKLQQFLSASLFWRWLMSLSSWFSLQWKGSVAVHALLTPTALPRSASESSVFSKLFVWMRNLLHRIYAALKLDRLFDGSIFLHSALWCCVLAGLVAIIPTMAALGLALLSMASLALIVIRQKEYRLVYSPINRFLLLFAAVYAFAIAISISPMDSIFPGLLTIAFVLVPILLQNVLVTRRTLSAFTAVLILGSAVVSVVAIYQYIFGASGAAAWVDSDMFTDITTRVYGTLDNPNMLAQYLVLTLPFVVPLFFSAKKLWTKVVWLGCGGLIVLALLFTFSRGGWIGAILAAGIYALLLSPSLLLLVPFALIALFLVLPETIIDRFTSIGDLSDSSTSYRVSIWMGSIAMLKDYWFCGVGPGTATFNLLYPLYSFSAASAQHPHNLFLQLMVDGGICVLAIFLLIIFAFCRHICVVLSKRPPLALRLYLIAAIAGVGGFLAQGMTDYSFYNHRVALAFWIVIGLGTAWANFAQKEVASS